MDSIKRLLISAFAAFALQASAQNIGGIWNGELNAGIQKIHNESLFLELVGKYNRDCRLILLV